MIPVMTPLIISMLSSARVYSVLREPGLCSFQRGCRRRRRCHLEFYSSIAILAQRRRFITRKAVCQISSASIFAGKQLEDGHAVSDYIHPEGVHAPLGTSPPICKYMYLCMCIYKYTYVHTWPTLADEKEWEDEDEEMRRMR